MYRAAVDGRADKSPSPTRERPEGTSDRRRFKVAVAAIVLGLLVAIGMAVIGGSDDTRYPGFTAIVGLLLFCALGARICKAEDLTVALLLWVLFFAAAEVITVSLVADSDEVRDVGLTAIGGVLLLLGAYFTARNLRQTARSSFLDRLMHASELLSAIDDPVKQTAGRVTLERLSSLAAHAGDKEEEAAAKAVLAQAPTPRADAPPMASGALEEVQTPRRD